MSWHFSRKLCARRSIRKPGMKTGTTRPSHSERMLKRRPGPPWRGNIPEQRAPRDGRPWKAGREDRGRGRGTKDKNRLRTASSSRLRMQGPAGHSREHAVPGGGRATAFIQTSEPHTPKARPCEMTAPSACPSRQRSKQGQPFREILDLSPHEGQCQPPVSSRAQIGPYVHCFHGFRGRSRKRPIIFIPNLHNEQEVTQSQRMMGVLHIVEAPAGGQAPLQPLIQQAPRPWLASLKITSLSPIRLLILGHLGDNPPMKRSPIAVSEPEEATNTQKPLSQVFSRSLLSNANEMVRSQVHHKVHSASKVSVSTLMMNLLCIKHRARHCERPKEAKALGSAWKMSTDCLGKRDRCDFSE